MTKYTSSAQESSRSTVRTSSPDTAAGSNGIAIAPPAYGIEVVDRERAADVSEQVQEPQSLASTIWPASEGMVQRKVTAAGAARDSNGGRQENRTGLPDHLKAGVETLSGLSMDDVNVHYNSPKPAQLQALAYAQGTDIHLAPGQERHVPHEAWHVVQQKQGRVKPSLQAKGVAINVDRGLESEADVMGEMAAQRPLDTQDFASVSVPSTKQGKEVVQGNFLDHPYWDYEAEHPNHDIPYEEWLKRNPKSLKQEVENLEEESRGVQVDVDDEDLLNHPYWEYQAQHPSRDITFEEWLEKENPEYVEEAEEFQKSVEKVPKKMSTVRTSLTLLVEAALHIGGAIGMFIAGTAGAISLLGAPAAVVLYIVGGGQLLIGASKVFRSIITELKTQAENAGDKETAKKHKRGLDFLIAGEGAIWAVTMTIASLANPLAMVSAIGGWIKVLRGLGGLLGKVGPTMAKHMKSAEAIFSVVSSLPALLGKGGWELAKKIFGLGRQLLKYGRTWAGTKELKKAKGKGKEED